MSTDKAPLPEAVREQMEKTADALLWDSVPLCDETVQEILCEFALVCLKAAAQQEHRGAPADSLMRMAYTQDLTQLVQDRDQWKARAEALEAAAQQERARPSGLEQLVQDLWDHARECGWQDVDEPIAALLAWVASHPPPTPAQACCEPAPDRSGRQCDKPKGHDGAHWTYGGDCLAWHPPPTPEER